MPLENQEKNECDPAFGDHWEMKNLRGEINTVRISSADNLPFVSPMSLAVLEDSSWWKPDYSMVEGNNLVKGREWGYIYYLLWRTRTRLYIALFRTTKFITSYDTHLYY